MLKIFFSADTNEAENSMLGKLFMGLMLGVAVGWVILKRFQRPAVESFDHSQSSGSTKEIELTSAVAEAEIKPDSPVSATPEPAPARDRLEAIKGIGPVFARRLNEAGIYTYAELAESSPDKLREIVAAKSWQAVEPEEWIKEARSRG